MADPSAGYFGGAASAAASGRAGASTAPSAKPADGAPYLARFSADGFSATAYDSSYSKLRRWIEESLDVFKTELKDILFPLFEHCYLDMIAKGMVNEARQFFDSYKSDHVAFHSNDLHQLDMIHFPTQIQENEYARMHRTNRFTVPMTSTTFQLLISFLEDNDFVALLRILNTHVKIDVTNAKSKKKASGNAGVLGLTSNLGEFHAQSEVHTGMPPLDVRVREQIEAALKEEEEREGDTTHRLQHLFRQYRAENPADPPPPKPVPVPPMKAKEVRETVELIKDVAHRASLSPTSLPSICFYTWHNTYDTLTCATMTHDATLIAAGFSDSAIRIHSLTKDPLRAVIPRPGLTPDDMHHLGPADIDAMREPEGTPSKLLRGHSGAVFGTSFSPDKRYLVSCSEDQTVRLWSLETFANLVCYRGHSYPVWDVEFGPEGHYFATASHDRTARLWSCDHIYPLRIFAGHLSDVDTVRFHPNSSYLATGSSDKTARLWDVSRGACVRVFPGHSGAVQAVAFSPNGRLLATAGDDKYVHLWDIASGTRIKKMGGHRGLVTSVAFSSDGALLASAGLDGTVRLWDALKGEGEDEPVVVVDPATGKKKRKKVANNDLIETFRTKKTPAIGVQFTRRNLLLATGPFCPDL
ncbi:Transcription initiation factor TFIID subunit 5 [Allomyces arbusculus]|nr:Transcription initiation factor TFIID subunit 5 [Allomyces arbusculus]